MAKLSSYAKELKFRYAAVNTTRRHGLAPIRVISMTPVFLKGL